MGTFVLIAIIVVVACTGFAVLGAVIGARMEEKNLGAGSVEAEMRGGMSASVLGGLLGIIPFLIFIVILIATVITNPARPEDHSSSSAPSSAGH
jgi:amino acid transporter